MLIDVYGKLSDGQQLEFLEELNILQFFYNDSHSDLIEGPEVDIQIPKAAMKLHDHIKQSDDEQLAHVTDLATKRIIGHSKLMHKKRILGRHYGEYPKDRNYKVEIIL